MGPLGGASHVSIAGDVTVTLNGGLVAPRTVFCSIIIVQDQDFKKNTFCHNYFSGYRRLCK